MVIMNILIILSGAYIDFNNIVTGGASSPSASAPSAGPGGVLKSDALFAKIKAEVDKNKDLAKSIGGVFLYNITENGKTVKSWSEYYPLSLATR